MDVIGGKSAVVLMLVGLDEVGVSANPQMYPLP